MRLIHRHEWKWRQAVKLAYHRFYCRPCNSWVFIFGDGTANYFLFGGGVRKMRLDLTRFFRYVKG